MVTAESITDEQIRELRASRSWAPYWQGCFAAALGEVRPMPDIETRANARARCSELLAAAREKSK